VHHLIHPISLILQRKPVHLFPNQAYFPKKCAEPTELPLISISLRPGSSLRRRPGCSGRALWGWTQVPRIADQSELSDVWSLTIAAGGILKIAAVVTRSLGSICLLRISRPRRS
jgi:hypothetical protein